LCPCHQEKVRAAGERAREQVRERERAAGERVRAGEQEMERALGRATGMAVGLERVRVTPAAQETGLGLAQMTVTVQVVWWLLQCS
jgi:hypothetical protein